MQHHKRWQHAIITLLVLKLCFDRIFWDISPWWTAFNTCIQKFGGHYRTTLRCYFCFSVLFILKTGQRKKGRNTSNARLYCVGLQYTTQCYNFVTKAFTETYVPPWIYGIVFFLLMATLHNMRRTLLSKWVFPEVYGVDVKLIGFFHTLTFQIIRT